MPAFLVLILLEKWWGIRKGNDTIRTMDMVSSLTSGITNTIKDVLGLSVAVLSYNWMVTHWAIFHIESSIWLYIIAFLALDLTGYLVHRIDHEFNFFWNAHIIHHSSEDFNLACALRQSISTFVRLFTIFLLPAALLGVPTQIIAVVAPLHLFAQFWYHTQHIDRMGWLEKIIVTPSHHRVHHAINPEYLDKNYGQIFIFWDKWFGTFQEELPNVKPVYGITRPVRTWNPIKINFMHLWLLIKDAWHAQSWSDKLKIWFMPTGWRPADVAEKFPVFKIDDPYHFEKYETRAGSFFTIWVWAQLGILLLLISYLFGNIATIGSPGIFYYGLFIYIYVYAFTEQMDGNPKAWLWELLKLVTAGWLMWNTSGWFGIKKLHPSLPYLIGFYFIISQLLSIYFRKDKNRVPVTAA
ncbi:sterol desaturase family protein [Sediminibacterium sp.]|uniref:sterol desaturase family protein n=1 Tax=Sediminibacterium sp. TaxID=1917865 RepID=UPI003F698AF0